MKRHARSVAATFALAAFLSVLATPAAAKPDFAKKEKTPCITCHTMTEMPKRNAVGECYKAQGYNNLAACLKK